MLVSSYSSISFQFTLTTHSFSVRRIVLLFNFLKCSSAKRKHILIFSQLSLNPAAGAASTNTLAASTVAILPTPAPPNASIEANASTITSSNAKNSAIQGHAPSPVPLPVHKSQLQLPHRPVRGDVPGLVSKTERKAQSVPSSGVFAC